MHGAADATPPSGCCLTVPGLTKKTCFFLSFLSRASFFSRLIRFLPSLSTFSASLVPCCFVSLNPLELFFLLLYFPFSLTADYFPSRWRSGTEIIDADPVTCLYVYSSEVTHGRQ